MGGERIVSYLSVFGVPMQGARFFLGVEGIHEKIGATQNNAIKSCV